MTIGDFSVAQSRDVDPFVHEVALMKQLIQERTHRLEMLRELLSNAGSREVNAREIKLTYYVHPIYGHTFEIADDGCGMNFTNDVRMPGRLDRFLGLGLSAIAGLEADEFAWKGLGSKLAYQSRRLEIDTYNGNAAYSAVVNEPWQTIENGNKPRPQVTETSPESGQSLGTTIRIYGHPPHKEEEPLKFEDIADYLAHRSFAGYTRERTSPPRIILTVQNRTEEIPFGWPEFRRVPSPAPEGTVIVEPPITLSRNVRGTNRPVQLQIRGFYTWDDADYGLAPIHLNTGLVLSVKGIPYIRLDMKELASGQLAVANPGEGKCCLVVECDAVHTEMNLSRSGLVDSPVSDLFKRLVSEGIGQLENSPRHRAFRLVPKRRKDRIGATELQERKEELESPTQAWVYYQGDPTAGPIRLLREPRNETDTLAILWKLEALGALPFSTFSTLAYSGKGADLIVHFQEDDSSNPERYATFEVEYRFFNFKEHGHLIPQFPTVICWEVNPKPKLHVKKTSKPFKQVVQLEETTLRIYTLKGIPGVFVATDEEIRQREANEGWSSNL